MKTFMEILKIAKRESEDDDTACDINNEEFTRFRLWISAFRVGYEMGQAGVERYDDI